jgi:D-alanyl-D-alanine carboxypeptidase
MPNFPRADEVTIEMLTNMRSGIISYSELVPFLTTWYTDPTHFWTTDELIALAANADTIYLFDPGTSYSYSNTNTIILQKIIESVSGVSLEAQIRSRIINPLGLINTAYLIGGTQLPGYHPSGYWYNYYMPELPELTELLDVSWAAAAGSMISDIFELKTYAKALVDGTFLSDTLQQHRLACHDMGKSMIKYGMGIFEYKGFYGHNGGIHGFSSLMIHSSQRNCTIIIWYNCFLEDSEPTDLITIIPKLIYPEL